MSDDRRTPHARDTSVEREYIVTCVRHEVVEISVEAANAKDAVARANAGEGDGAYPTNQTWMTVRGVKRA